LATSQTLSLENDKSVGKVRQTDILEELAVRRINVGAMILQPHGARFTGGRRGNWGGWLQ